MHNKCSHPFCNKCKLWISSGPPQTIVRFFTCYAIVCICTAHMTMELWWQLRVRAILSKIYWLIFRIHSKCIFASYVSLLFNCLYAYCVFGNSMKMEFLHFVYLLSSLFFTFIFVVVVVFSTPFSKFLLGIWLWLWCITFRWFLAGKLIALKSNMHDKHIPTKM